VFLVDATTEQVVDDKVDPPSHPWFHGPSHCGTTPAPIAPIAAAHAPSRVVAIVAPV
jgi:hypothetical protein